MRQSFDPEMLSWLAECQRNRYVSVPIAENVRMTLRESPEAWTRGISYLDRELEYEPRSLAVSSNGTRIAMGTKAGRIHLARWSDERWEMGEEPFEVPREEDPRSRRPLGKAVRGLCFLGPDLLVAGGGPGIFTVFDLAGKGGGAPTSRSFSQTIPPQGEDRWLLRFAKILPLFAGSALPAEPGVLALGVTQGKYLHVLRREMDGRFEATFATAEDLLGYPKLGEAVWIIDGEWWQDCLWLLDSKGGIHRLSPGRGPLGLELSQSFQVPYFRPRIDPRSISLCKAGIGVRVGEDVTFLSLRALEEETVENAQWVAVPGANRCIAIQEFGTDDWAYLAVATTDAGVRWIPGRLLSSGVWQPSNRGGQQPLSGSARDPVLEMAVVRRHPGQVYLALSTRGHRFRIASLLDRNLVEKKLDESIGQALENPAELDALLEKAKQAGMAKRLLRSLIDLELEDAYRAYGDKETGPAAGSLLAKKESELFEALELADLPDVLRQFGRSWRSSHRSDHSAEAEDMIPPPERRAGLYRRFCLRAFQRAARLDEKSLRHLAYAVLAAIEDLHRDLAPEEWARVGLFGGFLRKWFLYGHTYGDKHENLLQLSEWNRACGRDLDAILYLTRILRLRLDASWFRTVEPTGVDPAVWDMVGTEGARFLLHSHTDGRIFATSRDGRAVRWAHDASRPEPARALEDGAIIASDAGFALCHRDAKDFRERYRHGPYARSLHLEELETDRSFLVVFGIRGWNPIDPRLADPEVEARRLPRLVALVVEWEEDAKEPRLVIREAAVCALDFEPYAIVRLPARDGPSEGFELIVGTGGGSEPPFQEVQLLRGKAGLSMAMKIPTVQEDPRWRAIPLFRNAPPAEDPAMRFAQGSNPCWAAQALEVHPDGGGRSDVWLWIGMQDGRVRPFLWDRGQERWLEGGPRYVNEEREIRPVLDPILTFSPLRRLRVLRPPGGPGPGGPLLAYGNAAGVVGVVPLSHLSEDHRKRAAVEKRLPEWNEPWIHLIHTREKRAICGLADYRDGDDWNLAVLTESGRVAIFNLEHRKEDPQVAGRRFIHRGLRLDYFLLPSAQGYARALFASSDREPGSWEALRNEKAGEPVGDEEQEREKILPFLVVGGEDGTVRRYVLTFPKFSPRRNGRAVPLLLDLFARQVEGFGKIPVPYLVRSLGEENIHSWLRLCDVGGKSLLRFSLWYELHDLHQKQFPPSAPAGDLVAKAEAYSAKLLSLADEVYDRKPFDNEAAKILWSETARYANKVAGIGVGHAEVRAQALKAYGHLLVEMDNLSNRWIGAGQPEEAKVLMHSFSDLFDWPGIVLLALDDPGGDLQEARKLLLFQAVQRRLRHNDILVPLEAIRVINTAILRAIVKRRQQHAEEWSFAHRPRNGGIGFYDLLTLVSNLVRQQAGRLTPSDPLYTEISKFLALSILLVPKGIFAVGRLVSASRLAEHETDVARRILGQARMFREQLERDFEIPVAETDFEGSVRRFEDYLSRDVDLEIDRTAGPAAAHPWQRLLAGTCDEAEAPLTDPHYLSEQRQVFFTVANLARLQAEEPGAFAWLDTGKEPEYFQESREYLRHLQKKREQLLRSSTRPDKAEPPSRICDQELRELAEWPTLVEPQRSHYRRIIEQWRSELDVLGQQAIDLVGLIERFNRHVYRTSADDLMASLTELALRSAPLAFQGGPITGPLRLEIRNQVRSFPFLSELFRRGTLLVQGSHLAGALLHLATACLDPKNASGSAFFSGQYTLAEIKEKVKEIAELEGVEQVFFPENPGEVLVPGDEFVWSTILRELARNVYDYCSAPGGNPKIRIVWCSGRSTQEGTKWFLAVGGNRSFHDALGGDATGKSGAPIAPEILQEKVKAILARPGVRHHTEPRGSFGFGLYFLHRLFELLGGARAQLLLLDPDRLPLMLCGAGPEACVREPRTALETLPLTMVFSWVSRP